MHGLDWLEGDVLIDGTIEFCSICSYLREEHGLSEDWESEEYEDGVPPLFDGEPFLEIVYGHRRVEASRRAGLTEVPAIVEGLEDWTALLQQIIENEVRTDVIIDERAAGYRSALNHPMNPKPGSVHYLATSTGVPISRIRESLTYLEQIEEGVVGSNNSAGDASIRQVIELKSILGDDTDSKRAVYEKHKSEELNWRETRAVAEAYKAADTPELKDAVLNTSGKLGDADRILEVARMKVGVNNMTERHEIERRQAYEEYDQATKDFFDFTAHALRFAKSTQNTVRYGKFSPEAARFAIRRIDSLMDELTALKEALEGVN